MAGTNEAAIAPVLRQRFGKRVAQTCGESWVDLGGGLARLAKLLRKAAGFVQQDARRHWRRQLRRAAPRDRVDRRD